MGTIEAYKKCKHACEARAGMSIVEITVAMAILLVVMMGYSLAASTTLNMSETEGERSLAREGAREALEQLGDMDFLQVFARFNANPEDDPAAVDSPGSAFDVAGLTPVGDDPDGRVGEILFPTDELGRLLESVDQPWLGMPRDLNGDGGVDDFDHAGDYALLPVLVRVEWMGKRGRNKIEFKTILKEW